MKNTIRTKQKGVSMIDIEREIGPVLLREMNVQEAERKRQDEERMRECRINAIDEMMKAWDLTLYDLKAYESHDCGCGCCR